MLICSEEVMMSTITFALSFPEEYMAPVAGARTPVLILQGRLNESAQRGENTLLLGRKGFSVHNIFRQAAGHWQAFKASREPFEFMFLNEPQWRERESSYAWLAHSLGCSQGEYDGLHPWIGFYRTANGEVIL